MKIVFDSEEEKQKYFQSYCADSIGFVSHDDCPTPIDCIKCWENSSLKYEIKGDDDTLNELWEMVKHITISVSRGGMNVDELDHTFGTTNYNDIFDKFTPEEALANYRVWKEKRKFSVGDVVYMDDALDAFGVVTYFEADDIDGNHIHVLWYDGSTNVYAANDPEIHKHPNGYRMRIDEYVLNDLKEWGWERRD